MLLINFLSLNILAIYFFEQTLPVLDPLELGGACVHGLWNIGVCMRWRACVLESWLDVIMREYVYTAVCDSRIKC